MNYDGDTIENDIVHGDCEKTLKRLKDDSVDLICTDPPYGYGFKGKDWDKTVPKVEIWKECYRVLKPGGFAFVMSAPRADVLSAMIIRLREAGFKLDFTPVYWAYASGFPHGANMGRLVDKKLGAKRTGIKKGGLGEAGYWGKGYKSEFVVGAPVTPEAKALEGAYAGFQPKPAVEVIIVAMKPISEKTHIEQAMKNQKGVTWLDDCRVPCEESAPEKNNTKNDYWNEKLSQDENDDVDASAYEPSGKYPANLIVSDNCLNSNTSEESFSSHFDLDQWYKERLKEMPKDAKDNYPFLIVPKPTREEKERGMKKTKKEKGEKESEGYEYELGRKNFHPTVKPLKLMEYLVILGSREGDLVIDPFVGSGTTCVAAQNLGRRFIGMELTEEYWHIAKERIMNQPASLF